jgi:hypothetical protein
MTTPTATNSIATESGLTVDVAFPATTITADLPGLCRHSSDTPEPQPPVE